MTFDVMNVGDYANTLQNLFQWRSEMFRTVVIMCNCKYSVNRAFGLQLFSRAKGFFFTKGLLFFIFSPENKISHFYIPLVYRGYLLVTLITNFGSDLLRGIMRFISSIMKIKSIFSEQKDLKKRKQEQKEQRAKEEQISNAVKLWKTEILPNWNSV